MTEQEAFTTYLRRHRQRTGVMLPTIAAATNIRVDLLEGLERNEFDGWPRGLYARAYVRDYAMAIGLDPEEIVDEFCRLYPHGDRRAESTMKEMAAIVAAESMWRDEFGHTIDRRASSATIAHTSVRVTTLRDVVAIGVRALRAAAAALTRSAAGAGSVRLRRRGHVEPTR